MRGHCPPAAQSAMDGTLLTFGTESGEAGILDLA
jgi:hypothetical protein